VKAKLQKTIFPVCITRILKYRKNFKILIKIIVNNFDLPIFAKYENSFK